MTPAPTTEYSEVDSKMKLIHTRPPPPRLEDSVGTAYVEGKLNSDAVDEGNVEADDVKTDDVRSLRDTADDTIAHPQEASAPDIAAAIASAETHEVTHERKQEEQEEKQKKQEEEQEEEAIPQCITCLRNVDMVLTNTYQVMSLSSGSCGADITQKVKRNLCNQREAQLRKQFGPWPPTSFSLLTATRTSEFWKRLR